MATTKKEKNLGIYLDHNATTPVDPQVLEAMLPYLQWNFGNASSIHSFGVEARYGVEKARSQVAKALNTEMENIVFTGCGSESDNIALKGVMRANRDRGKHLITTTIEHKAIMESAKSLEAEGFEVTYIGVDREGRVAPAAVERAIRKDTVLVSIMFANNEVGTIEPIEEVARITKKKGVIFHTDAVQAFGRIQLDVEKLGVDLLSASAHKLYGPKGVGALYVRPGIKVHGIIEGGSQEKGLRAGTENVAGIVGFGKAIQIAAKAMDEEAQRLSKLRDRLHKGLVEKIKDLCLNGHPTERLPGTLNLGIKGISGQRLVLALNERGVAISAGSACTSHGTALSHVLVGMGIEKEVAAGSIRMSLGRGTTEEDIKFCLKVIPEAVEELRKLPPEKGLEGEPC